MEPTADLVGEATGFESASEEGSLAKVSETAEGAEACETGSVGVESAGRAGGGVGTAGDAGLLVASPEDAGFTAGEGGAGTVRGR